jgi:hypothetical protein
MPMNREQLLQVQSAARVFQSRADDAFSTWGQRAPAPVMGQDPDEYRRKLMIKAKNLLPEGHELRNITVNRLPASTLDIFEPQLFAACKDAGQRNDSVPPGEMRMVERINPDNGHKMNVFYGTRSFIEDFKLPVRRVVSFWTPQGPMSASGRYLR